MPDYFSDNHGDNDGDESDPGTPGKDLQPGHTCKVKIEKVLADQVQVSYVGEEGGGGSDDMMA